MNADLEIKMPGTSNAMSAHLQTRLKEWFGIGVQELCKIQERIKGCKVSSSRLDTAIAITNSQIMVTCIGPAQGEGLMEL